MDNFEDFDLIFEALTKGWDASIKEKCKADYEEVKKESLNLIDKFNKILNDETLTDQIKVEIDKRIRS